MNPKRLEVFFEFLIFGVLVGITEDLIAITFATDAKITAHVFVIVILIAIPFAFIGEILVDRVDFIALFQKLFKKDNQSK